MNYLTTFLKAHDHYLTNTPQAIRCTTFMVSNGPLVSFVCYKNSKLKVFFQNKGTWLIVNRINEHEWVITSDRLAKFFYYDEKTYLNDKFINTLTYLLNGYSNKFYTTFLQNLYTVLNEMSKSQIVDEYQELKANNVYLLDNFCYRHETKDNYLTIQQISAGDILPTSKIIVKFFTKLGNQFWHKLNLNQTQNILAFNVMFDEVAGKWVNGVLIDKEGHFVFKTIKIEDLAALSGDLRFKDTLPKAYDYLLQAIKNNVNSELDLIYPNQDLINKYVKILNKRNTALEEKAKIIHGLINFYSQYYNIQQYIRMKNNKEIRDKLLALKNRHIIDLDGNVLDVLTFITKYTNQNVGTFTNKQAKRL